MVIIPEDKHKNTYFDEYTIMVHDVDARYKLKPSAFFRYIQETANHQMRDCRPNYEELFESGRAFILSRLTINVYETPTQYDKIVVQTWPCVDKGILFNRCYRMIRDGKIIAEALSAWAFVDIPSGNFIRYSPDLFSNYTHSEKLEGLNMRFRMPKDGYEYKGSRQVLYNDTDVNGHMNNTVYPDILTGFCPEIFQKTPVSMSIYYASEAKCGEIMDIHVCSCEEEGKSVCYVRSMIKDCVNVEARFVFE